MACQCTQIGRDPRLRSLAAHAARGRALSRRRRKGWCGACALSRQPARPGLAGPAGRAVRAGRAACRYILPARARSRNATRLAAGLAEEGVAAAVVLTMPEFDRLAAQHPRRRRAAHAVAVVLCDPAARRRVHPVYRPAQARPRPRTPSRQCRHRAAARAIGTGARRARGGRRAGAGRPGDRRRVDLRPARKRRARRSIAPPIRACCRRRARTPAEIDGTRAAHRRDGAALTRFLAWLAREAPKAGSREIAASDRLEALPPRGRVFPRSELSDDLGRRLERRDCPLPGDAGDRKAARTRQPLSARFRRPISRRHHRCDAHDRDRRAVGRRCATASPAC